MVGSLLNCSQHSSGYITCFNTVGVFGLKLLILSILLSVAERHYLKLYNKTQIVQQHKRQQLTIKMKLSFFCITIIATAFASVEAARNKRDEFEFEVCPDSHPYAVDNGKVSVCKFVFFFINPSAMASLFS
jgi:hypothetical protein